MRTRSSGRSEIPVISPSTWRPVDISSGAPTARGAFGSMNGSSGAIRYAAEEPREMEASLYLFALCRQLQTIYLARRGIDFVLDAAGAGRLPEATCRMLGSMLYELVRDAGSRSQPETARRTVSVTLRRRGTICLCTISGQGDMDPAGDAQPGLQRARGLALELGGSCMVRAMPDRGVTAIMFDVLFVERRFPAAIRRRRASDVWRRAGGHPQTVLE
jgi:hypothetical protein